jgi:tetratricopeptide (TPR) repeat protein
MVGKTLHNMAVVEGNLDHLDAAIALEERAVAIKIKVHGPEHQDVARSLMSLGMFHYLRRDNATAIATLRRVLSIYEKTIGTEHVEYAEALHDLGGLLRAEKRWAEALPLHERAAAVFAKTIAPDAPDLAAAYMAVGECLQALGRAAAAVEPLEHALAIFAKHGNDAESLADTRFALAKALWDAGRDRPRALSLMAQARDGFATLDNAVHRRAEAAAWLRARE